jgi:hypothetical protein
MKRGVGIFSSGVPQFSRTAIQSVKRKLIDTYINLSFSKTVRSNLNSFRKSPYRNPLAFINQNDPPTYTDSEQIVQEACRKSSRIVVEKKHMKILRQFFTQTQATDSVLGRFYQTMTFEDFLQRLINKRFLTCYLNGSVLMPRDSGDVLGRALLKDSFFKLFHGYNPLSHHRELLLNIGTECDSDEVYKEYLTLQELFLTPMLQPQTVSIMIGTGSRSTDWPYVREAQLSTDLAVLTYTVAPEFGDGGTLHLDFIFCVVLDNHSTEFSMRIKEIKENTPLMNAARQMHGGKVAIDFTADEAKKNLDGDFLPLNVMDVDVWLYKPAYRTRLKSLLTTLFLSNDEAMHRAGTGSVFVLKGMGLGEFGFSEPDNQEKLEALYVETVQEVLSEIAHKFNHIRTVSLTNFPSDWKKFAKTHQVETYSVGQYAKVRLVRSVTSPTCKNLPQDNEEIGATSICGDSGSFVGNEGQIGLERENSDDPAALYSMLDPTQLDPRYNPCLQSVDSFVILDIETNAVIPFRESTFGKGSESNASDTPMTHRFD